MSNEAVTYNFGRMKSLVKNSAVSTPSMMSDLLMFPGRSMSMVIY